MHKWFKYIFYLQLFQNFIYHSAFSIEYSNTWTECIQLTQAKPRAAIQTPLSLTDSLICWFSDPLVKISLRRRHAKTIKMVLPVTKQTILPFCRHFKSWRASKSLYWFKSWSCIRKGLPYSLRSRFNCSYLVFGYSHSGTKFSIWYWMTSKNRLILGFCIQSLKSIFHTFKWTLDMNGLFLIFIESWLRTIQVLIKSWSHKNTLFFFNNGFLTSLYLRQSNKIGGHILQDYTQPYFQPPAGISMYPAFNRTNRFTYFLLNETRWIGKKIILNSFYISGSEWIQI